MLLLIVKKNVLLRMDIVQTIAAFASANAGVTLAQSFVSNIISPISAKLLGTLDLSELKFAGLGLGSFIEAIIQFVTVVLIVSFAVKYFKS